MSSRCPPPGGRGGAAASARNQMRSRRRTSHTPDLSVSPVDDKASDLQWRRKKSKAKIYRAKVNREGLARATMSVTTSTLKPVIRKKPVVMNIVDWKKKTKRNASRGLAAAAAAATAKGVRSTDECDEPAAAGTPPSYSFLDRQDGHMAPVPSRMRSRAMRRLDFDDMRVENIKKGARYPPESRPVTSSVIMDNKDFSLVYNRRATMFTRHSVDINHLDGISATHRTPMVHTDLITSCGDATKESSGTQIQQFSSSNKYSSAPVKKRRRNPTNLTIEEPSCIQVENQLSRAPNASFQGVDALVPYTPLAKEDKSSSRARVYLDDETISMWKLLISNNQVTRGDVHGGDDEKYWKCERELFHGRVMAFISCMTCYQGSKRFLKWKGSVVDSVVGTFLTQNVSDHFSSSSFMELASRYPARLSSTTKELFVFSHTNLAESSRRVANQNVEKIAPPANKAKAKLRKKVKFDWESIRKEAMSKIDWKGGDSDHTDSANWEAVRKSEVKEVADAIEGRGMHNVLAERIQGFLNKLVENHGTINLEWLRHVEPDTVTNYLLSLYGLGNKSVECIRLLTLNQLAFPVDINVARIAVRLGWVPLEPSPESPPLHLIKLYPMMGKVQKYLWPRLCNLDHETLYELHCQLITFGKVFCTKRRPNCRACPLKAECKHYASAQASAKPLLNGPEEDCSDSSTLVGKCGPNQSHIIRWGNPFTCGPIIEEPSSPKHECYEQYVEQDIEDLCKKDDPDEIHAVILNSYMGSMPVTKYNDHGATCSMAIVPVSPVASSSIPAGPNLKNVDRRRRTVHQICKINDDCPLLSLLNMETRDVVDLNPYLLAIWEPGEIRKLKAKQLETIGDSRESETVKGTILIPCLRATRKRFPLNGTYFQTNEVFADHYSSENPVEIPWECLHFMPRRTCYFGTSLRSICSGLSGDEIQSIFLEGFVCIRGFDRETGSPRRLNRGLHFASKKESR